MRDVFQQRSLYHLFDGGIYGSPDTKNIILEREILSGQISMPAIFFGDSLYDYKASLNASIDFVFVSGWTEFDGWQDFVLKENLCVIKRLSDLLR